MKAISLFVMMSVSLVFAENTQWSCWRGPNHDGKSSDTGLLKQWPEDGPQLLWKQTGFGKGFATVSLSGDLIYTTGDVEKEELLFAIETDGTVKWKVPVDKSWDTNYAGSRSTPTIDSGKVYVQSVHGAVACFDAISGKKIWSKDLTSLGGEGGVWGYTESILIHKDLAIVKAGGYNCILAFNKNTGDIVWASTDVSAEPDYSSCVPFTHQGISMIAIGTKAGLFCISADSGKLLWSNDFSAGNLANCPDPAYANGYIFWANGYKKGGICLKLSVDDGKVSAKEVWTTKDMDCHHGGYIIHDGYIYGNHNRGWSCLELKTGKLMWNEKAVGKGCLTFADDMLYLLGEGGSAALATCSPAGLEIKGTLKIEGTRKSWAHPVVFGGRLYLRYADNLYCYNVSAK